MPGPPIAACRVSLCGLVFDGKVGVSGVTVGLVRGSR